LGLADQNIERAGRLEPVNNRLPLRGANAAVDHTDFIFSRNKAASPWVSPGRKAGAKGTTKMKTNVSVTFKCQCGRGYKLAQPETMRTIEENMIDHGFVRGPSDQWYCSEACLEAHKIAQAKGMEY
jgi:hypothetical protein